MKLVITGSRSGHPDVERWMRAFAEKHGKPELTVVGDAGGVDNQAFTFVVTHLWSYAFLRVNQMKPSPERFHDRNQRMVDLAGPGDWCLAFPDSKSKGTYDCARRAEGRGLSLKVARVWRVS